MTNLLGRNLLKETDLSREEFLYLLDFAARLREAKRARRERQYLTGQNIALIRNPLTPLARVLAFLPDLAVTDLRDICLDHRMPQPVRKYIEAHCAARLKRQ